MGGWVWVGVCVRTSECLANFRSTCHTHTHARACTNTQLMRVNAAPKRHLETPYFIERVVDRQGVSRCWKYLRMRYSPLEADEDEDPARIPLTLRGLFSVLTRNGENMAAFPYDGRIWRPLVGLIRKYYVVTDAGDILVKSRSSHAKARTLFRWEQA